MQVPAQHICCGRPLYDFGFLDQARKYLEDILERFGPQIDSGMPFVVLEPSCASVFRDELINFFPANERAVRLAKQTFLLSEFLTRQAPGYQPPQLAGRQMVLHGHCHQKSLMGMQDEISLLQATKRPGKYAGFRVAVGWRARSGLRKTSLRFRRRWASACFCPRYDRPRRRRFWSPMASAAGSRSGRIRRATHVHLAEVLAGRC